MTAPAADADGVLILESRHTGERLQLRRVVGENGQVDLELHGSLPARSEGPPLHVHVRQDESGRVLSGTLSAVCDGRRVTVAAGGSASFPRGSAHRWWNERDETLVFEGRASPADDLDRYLQAVFDVFNAGPPDRPPLFYMAHVLHRHRKTQVALVVPPFVQRLLFPMVIGLGRLLGKYRGTDWPGSPARCSGAPAPGNRR